MTALDPLECLNSRARGEGPLCGEPDSAHCEGGCEMCPGSCTCDTRQTIVPNDSTRAFNATKHLPQAKPPVTFRHPAARLAALKDALAGVELGAWDEQLLLYIASNDDATAAGIESLILRARHAGTSKEQK